MNKIQAIREMAVLEEIDSCRGPKPKVIRERSSMAILHYPWYWRHPLRARNVIITVDIGTGKVSRWRY